MATSGTNGGGTSSVELVQAALAGLEDHSTRPGSIERFFSPNFLLRSNGESMDLQGFVKAWREREAQLAETCFDFEEMAAEGDQVAVVRVCRVKTKDGIHHLANVKVVDVWQVAGGKIVGGEQCWQRLRGPAGDDLPLSPREGQICELVRTALESLQSLGSVQDYLHKYWDPGYQGRVDGVQMDFSALCRHWAALQATLSTLIVDIKDMVSRGSAVGAIYHLKVRKRDGGRADVRLLAVFTVAGGRIASCAAVSKVVCGNSQQDAQLATLMPVQ